MCSQNAHEQETQPLIRVNFSTGTSRMIEWLKKGSNTALVLLCLYGLFKEIRPSEPFLTEYLIDARWGDLSKDDLYSKVYPVWSYSYFFLLIPVFVLTDFLRYKPVICLEGLSYIATWTLLLWFHGVPAMQAMQAVYGIATSTEVAYYTYIYAQVFHIANFGNEKTTTSGFCRWEQTSLKKYRALQGLRCSSEGSPVVFWLKF